MRPDDLIGKMLCDDDAVLLFDRRIDVARQALTLGYELYDCVQASSPISGSKINIALLRPADKISGEDTTDSIMGLRQGKPKFIRLLDRFFLPASGDPVISSLFFELIAGRYNELTASDINRRMAQSLLKSALGGLPFERPTKVLDFGCGTGFALSALNTLGPRRSSVELVGTDLSDAMLAIARGQGEVVMAMESWRSMQNDIFDAAIACFVLHYGVALADLKHIGRQLKPGSAFSANFFKGDEARVARLTKEMSMAGLDLESSEQSTLTPDTFNHVLTFRKRSGCGCAS